MELYYIRICFLAILIFPFLRILRSFAPVEHLQKGIAMMYNDAKYDSRKNSKGRKTAMDKEKVLDVAADVGYRLSVCGAETFRVEESMARILGAYGIPAEVFALPSCLFVSIRDGGKTASRMRRIEELSNDMDGVEHYSQLSRRICSEAPEAEIAERLVTEADTERTHYGTVLRYIGHYLAAFGFCLFFGGIFTDALVSGFCGIIAGLVDSFLHRHKANLFFRTILASLLFSLPAYLLHGLGIVSNSGAVVIGALMPLIPGLMFTNAMRDIIYGHMISAVVRTLQVVLVALAIAIGTAVAWNTAQWICGPIVSGETVSYSLWGQEFACMIACLGFSLMFNIHGKGFFLCVLGGMLSWLLYGFCAAGGLSDVAGYFWASAFAGVYAEVMARIRKYPAISYLIISLVPLIPGSGLYYTMTYAVEGAVEQCLRTGIHTVVLTGIMAVGVIMVNTTVRLVSGWRKEKTGQKIA